MYEIFIQTADHLANVLSQHGVNVGRIEGHLSIALDIIQKQDFRIIFVVGSEISSQQVLCHIHQKRLYDVAKYVWFFVGETFFDNFVKRFQSKSRYKIFIK
jgi:hypothetical protein